MKAHGLGSLGAVILPKCLQDFGMFFYYCLPALFQSNGLGTQNGDQGVDVLGYGFQSKGLRSSWSVFLLQLLWLSN